jgi:AmmeMemoRadiSam system protein B
MLRRNRVTKYFAWHDDHLGGWGRAFDNSSIRLSTKEVTMSVRPPAVAGLFYPRDARELRAVLTGCLEGHPVPAGAPKAIIAPHAGYEYSGPVAGSAYALVRAGRGTITRVALLGPSHRVGFSGLALPADSWFSTPLGAIPIDSEAVTRIRALGQVTLLDRAHAREHSLEVQLPFLQIVLGPFTLVPLVVGEASPAEVGEVLERLWGGAETLIVISSDLSHYHDYATARRMDRATAAAIEALRDEDIGEDDACGRAPVRGVLWLARRLGLQARTVDLRNSGDTAGPRDQVVGYGAFAIG